MSHLNLKFGHVVLFPPDLRVDWMKYRNLWIGISVVLVVLSLLVIGIKGLNYSIDFLGGTEITINVTDKSLTREEIVNATHKVSTTPVEVTTLTKIGSKSDESSYLLRFQRMKGEDEAQTSENGALFLANFRKTIGDEKFNVGSVTNISGKVGKEEQIKGYFSIGLALLGIMIYVMYRFDPRFAPGAVLCLLHDVVIAIGFMTAIGRPFSVGSIAAFLTIVGYSINDTIIIYDRIREIQRIDPRQNITDTINLSINQTMSRTVLTMFAGGISLLVLSILGGGAIEDFALTMLVGFVVGTYSSIYVAAPLTIVLDGWARKMGWEQKEKKKKVAADPNYIPPVIMRKRNNN